MIIGDIHANKNSYLDLIKQTDFSIQVGDFGMGFGMEKLDLPSNHYFIRGNHDHPTLCKQSPNFIDSGVHSEFPNMFFLGGALSIDKYSRTPGWDWWPDEEHSYSELCKLIKLYSIKKPKIVISHEAPGIIIERLFTLHSYKPSLTAQALSNMFEIHQPDYWYFGHWHKTRLNTINQTTFICVGTGDMVPMYWLMEE